MSVVLDQLHSKIVPAKTLFPKYVRGIEHRMTVVRYNTVNPKLL